MLFLTSISFALITTSLAIDVHENSTNVTKQFTSETKPNSTEIVSLNGTDSKQNINMFRITQPSTISNTVTAQNGIKQTKHDHFSNDRFVPSPQLESYIEYNSFAIRPGVSDTRNIYSKNAYLPPTPSNVTLMHAGKTLSSIGQEERTILTAPNGKQDIQNKNYYPTLPYATGHEERTILTAPNVKQDISNKNYYPTLPYATGHEERTILTPPNVKQDIPNKNYYPTLQYPTGQEEHTILTAPNVKQDIPTENYYPNHFYLPVGHSITFTTSVPPFSSTSELPIPSAQDKQLIFPPTVEKPVRFEGDFPSLKFYERYNYGPSAFPSALYQNLPNYEWFNKMVSPTKQAPVSVAEHPYPFVVNDLTKTLGVSAVSGPKSALELPLEKPMHSKMAPWRRAAKIFAAILPIGLLISALTPNILTITSANDTTAALCRKLTGRAEGLGINRAQIEKWSKPGCEARLLCETAIREDSIDVDSVKKLFWNFVSQNAEDAGTAVDIESVSNAIREKKCDKISCREVTTDTKD